MNNRLFALVSGTVLWSLAGWIAHPRELWDVGFFWPVWGVAILIAGALGLTRGSRPFPDTALVFLPLLGVLTVQTLVNGGSANLLPLGLVAFAILAAPGLILARLAYRLTARRR
jgi:hypothetical protein